MPFKNAARNDIHQTVTDAIIAQLERGVSPWMCPWNAEHMAGRVNRPLRHDGTPYRGINVLMLWAASIDKGYSAPLWLTYRQCQELGGQVNAGEKSTLVVYCDKITKGEGEEEREIFFTKTYCVFNAEQTTGLPERFYQMAAPQLDPVARIEHADAFIRNTGATIRHGGNSAHYCKADDRVQMPPFEAFRDAEAYYTTCLHELAHWTGHASRLNRELKSRKDADSYGFEELVAEISSCLSSADLGLAIEPREDHAAYIAHWLSILKADKRAIFQAAALAQKATDFLHGSQPEVSE